MKWLDMLTVVLVVGAAASAEDINRESFEGPARSEPLVRTWGDEPTTVSTNATAPAAGLDGTAAACLRLEFPDQTPHNLSYWQYNLSEPVPLVPELESISFQVKTNVPVSIKIAISPYGFIYHGPGVGPSAEWQKVTLADAYAALKKWCEGGNRPAEGGSVSGIIVAVGGTRGAKAEVVVDEIALEGPMVDDGYFFVRATSQTGQTDHRAYVMDPWGMPLGASQFRTNNEPIVVTLQLDNRPQYYEWPEDVRRAGPYPDPYKAGKRPVAKGDLRAVVLAERRPELYRPRPEPDKE